MYVPRFLYFSHTQHVSADNFGHYQVILQQYKRQNSNFTFYNCTFYTAAISPDAGRNMSHVRNKWTSEH